MEKHLLQNANITTWNKGKIIGQKRPLKLKEIWEIRIRLQLSNKTKELALFNLALDSKLRGCDLVKLKVCDIYQGGRVQSKAIVMQQKTHRPVQFEITEHTRESLKQWIEEKQLKLDHYLFPSRLHKSLHLSTSQYGRIIEKWVKSIGLDPTGYGTHSMRRTKATLNLSKNQEFTRCAIITRPYQTREHRKIFRNRSRRCAGVIRADRNLIFFITSDRFRAVTINCPKFQ